jgi:hypothetical protein
MQGDLRMQGDLGMLHPNKTLEFGVSEMSFPQLLRCNSCPKGWYFSTQRLLDSPHLNHW